MELQDISEKQSEILALLEGADGGVAHTGEITEATGYDNSTVGYHIRQLISRGLVERAGEVDIGAPRPANQYRITEAGRELAETAAEQREPPIEERLDRLETQVATDSESRGSLADNVGSSTDRLAELEQRVADLEGINAKLDTLRGEIGDVNRRLDQIL